MKVKGQGNLRSQGRVGKN